MADNQLTIKQDEIVPIIEQNGLGDLIKPLIREIYLFESYVAGTMYVEDTSVFEEINKDDKLILQRENNRFDKYAILVLTEEKKKVGYIPRKDNLVFSRLMDAGKILTVKIKEIERKGNYCEIKIKIYLVDI